MAKELYPFYLIGLDENDPETGVDFNSVVDFPAHMRAFETYGKPKKDYFIENEEQRMITGVVIAEGTPIFRDDKQLGKHFVVFMAPEIRKIWLNFNRNFRTNNVNKQHSLSDIVRPGTKGIFMVEQWIVDEENGRGVPKALRNQGIRKGSWIATYKIEDEKLWKEIKSGKYNGFSVEGMFVKWRVTVKKIGEKMSMIELHALARKIIKFTSK